MPIRTNEPRLPLEPEEYPLYRPPRRFGCSGLTIVTLLTLGIFALLVWKVTPNIATGLTDPIRRIFSSGTPTAEVIKGAGALSTQTAIAALPPTVTLVRPTPIVEYVVLGNNSGSQISMRKSADSTSAIVLKLKGGEIMQISSPDEKDKAGNVWRHVQLICNDGRNGWVLAKYLNSYNSVPPCP